MAKNRFDILEDEEVQEIVESANSKVVESEIVISDEDNKKISIPFRMEKYRMDKLKAYAKNRGLSANAVLINALVDQGVL